MDVVNASPFVVGLLLSEQGPDGPFLSVIVKGTFALERGSRPSLLCDSQRALLSTDVPYDSKLPGGELKFESDRVPYKPRTDVVLVGSAYAPHGRPVRFLDVTIAVGERIKTLRVFGERQWAFSSANELRPMIAGPTEFTNMQLRYQRAFGGIDRHAPLRRDEPSFRPWCERNPLGRGFCGAPTAESIHGTFLPNIEDPNEPVVAWNSNPVPTGCGFYPRTAEPRAGYFGTFDESWRATRAPGMPADFRFDCYNAADPSLQISPYLAGNERVVLSHVSPDAERLEFLLPSLTPAVAVVSERGFQEHPARLDTLLFVPGDRYFCQVWRSIVPIARPDASDVREVRVDYEKVPMLGSPTRP